MEVTEGEKLTPARNGAAQVGGFQRGQRRDLVRLAVKTLHPGRNRLRWCSRMVKPLHPGGNPLHVVKGIAPGQRLFRRRGGLKSGGGFSLTRLPAIGS